MATTPTPEDGLPGTTVSSAAGRGRALFWLSVLFLVVTQGTGFAAEVHTGQRVEIAGPLDEDVYSLGRDIVISGAVVGDIAALGQSVTMTGSSGGSVNAAALELRVDGQIGGSARLAGQQVVVGGKVTGDVVAAARSMVLGSQGVVGRDLVVATDELVVEGRVVRQLVGTAGSVTISGIVSGVQITADRVVVKQGARIEGDLIYTSDARAQVEDGAVVAGRLVRKRPAAPAGQNPVARTLAGVVGAALLGLVVLWLAPPLLPAASEALRRSPLASLAGALAGLIVLPLAIVVVVVAAIYSGVGGPLAVLLVAALTCGLVLSEVIAGFTVGGLLLRRTGVDPRDQFGAAFLCVLVGVVIIGILAAVPYVGAAIVGVVALAGFGAGLVAFLRWRRIARSVNILGSNVSS